MNTKAVIRNSSLTMLSQMIFWSRWLQAPLYLGLIVAQHYRLIR